MTAVETKDPPEVPEEQEPTTPTPEDTQKNLPRITVMETIFYQRPGEQPSSVRTRFHKRCKNSEQEYKRELSLTEVWTPLEYGWIGESPGMVTINNLETSTEKLVEVGIKFHSEPQSKSRTMFSPQLPKSTLPFILFTIPPLENLRVRIKPNTEFIWVVRSVLGSCKVNLRAYPE